MQNDLLAKYLRAFLKQFKLKSLFEAILKLKDVRRCMSSDKIFICLLFEATCFKKHKTIKKLSEMSQARLKNKCSSVTITSPVNKSD